MKKYKLILSLTLIVLLPLLMSAQQGTKLFSPEDFLRYSFYPKSIQGIRSMNDGEHYTVFDPYKSLILKYRYSDGELIDTLIDINMLDLFEVSNYELSNDEQKILFTTEEEPIYRHSFLAHFYVLDINTQTLTSVSETGKQQLATLSPDGNLVAFVQNNNIYLKNLTTGIETQITTDGELNKIINGSPDWVYEEEFSFNKAFEWSADGSKIAFIKFDESQVKQFNMTMFAGQAPVLTNNILYPEIRTWKYPKAGEDNSKVSVHIYDLATQKTIEAQTFNPEYIPRIKWTKRDNELAIYTINRHQNKLDILLINALDGGSTKLYTEENKYYIDVTDLTLEFINDKQFIISSEQDGYNHLYLYDMKGHKVRQLTTGNWEVTDFYGYDNKNDQLYYQAAETSPLQREVYVINLKGKNKTKLSELNGTNEAMFSKKFKYYIHHHQNLQTPYYITLHNNNGNQIRVLETNAEIISKIKEYNFNYKEFFSFNTTEGVQLNGWIIKPATFDQNKKYPVLMYQYSGPNSQEVTDTWDMAGFGAALHYILAQKGYIIVCVDGRGTGARGEAFKKITYQQLGKYESIDQIETAKYLSNFDYIDANRIGIWGWSYGGFMTALCLTTGADYFSTGVAIAPVTNWRYYDNIYTERYMRTPQENASGYDNNSPINHVTKFKGNLLLIHGMADDNVHLQNATEFAEALVQAGKQFDMMYYTNRNHGIYGGNTRNHLFYKVLNYITINL